jgi:glucose/arabinose dehydrogenase
MKKIAAVLVLALAAVVLVRRGSGKSVAPADTTGVRLVKVVDGLESPVFLTGRGSRLFIVEQVGRIRVFEQGHLRTWLDLSGRVGSGGERGLLSIAFRGDRLFADYTDRNGDTRVVELDSTGHERLLLFVRQPYANHNGGLVAIGPDSALYVGMGDGGAAGDPHGNAQNPRSQLGKLLRIDVDRGTVSTWAMGLRNPWRFAFDSSLLYIADVGQGSWEEVDVAEARDSGVNYGWRTMEGTHCFINPACSKAGLVQPVLEYGHNQGCSITGGVVYRGSVRALAGAYLYSDYCNGWLRSFRYVNGAATAQHEWSIGNVGTISSFGVGADGEVYLLSHSGGTVYRIAGN